MPDADDDLARRIHAAAHLTGEFRLRSGATSNEYFDKYRFESDPALLRAVAEALAPLVPSDAEALAGLELGGIPLATMVSQATGLPTVFVRKRAKAYGTARLAEGADVDGLRVAIVEDVVTSGGQIVESTQELRALGATVSDALCVIDREAGGGEHLADVGVTLHAAFTLSALRAA
jgi:orotate phosphoribosyltransferase